MSFRTIFYEKYKSEGRSVPKYNLAHLAQFLQINNDNTIIFLNCRLSVNIFLKKKAKEKVINFLLCQ